MGAMSFPVELAQRMRRMLDMYFSMVLRSAAWASRVRLSASLMMTTVLVGQNTPHSNLTETHF